MTKTRFSPSPTGLIHLGNARAALFSALYATSVKGTFLLRIEDTDKERSEHKYTELLQDDLHWLGVEWQEGPYWQSERHAIYEGYYKKLEELGLAYPCFCSDAELALNRKLQQSRGLPPRYPGTCYKLKPEVITERIEQGLKPALRFHVPAKTEIKFVDLVKHQQSFNSDDIGDFIIRRAEGTASFMFCNAIDDSLMGVTHVLRGDDHLANTPRQLMILNALKLRTPLYGHLSMITGDDGAPLSKRHGSFSVHDLRHQGFLPAASLNYLARLSHAYEQQYLMAFHELAENFNLEKISRAPARFDSNQLMHWQKEAVMSLDDDALWKWVGNDIYEIVPVHSRELFAEVMRKNILFPQDAQKWSNLFFGEHLHFTEEKLIVLREAGESFFVEARSAIQQHHYDLKKMLDELKTKINVSGKRLFMPIRIALTGEDHGPELIHIADLLGHEKLLQRLGDALAHVKNL